MRLKIAVAGSNRMNAEEVVAAMQLILGNVVQNVKIVITAEIADPAMADLFVCATTQAEELARRVPQNKRIVLDLQPTTQFFVEVARIPAGENVYVFNSNLRYVDRLIKSCKRVGIDELNFIRLGYEEMPDEAVKSSLTEAKYIIGIAKHVGEDILLSPRYSAYLRADVHIIGIHRVASMQSACMLIQWVAAYFHQSIAQQVSRITEKLRSTVLSTKDSLPDAALAGVANELDQLLVEGNQSILTMHDAVMKSFANQIAPHITMLDNPVAADDRPASKATRDISSSREIVQTLENISLLREKCLQLSHDLDAGKELE